MEAFTQAARIRQIAASNPMDRVAILRFMLAILYWCKGNPPTTVSIHKSFPEDWFSKLRDNKDSFNLLGDGKRFYQDRKASRNRTITELLQEIPTGNNFWHFKHVTDGLLCAACCTMGLLRLPLFSVSGLPDLKAGINGTPPIYFLPWRNSLFKTLLANWKTHSLLGTPSWENASLLPGEVPLLNGLTMLARRVFLNDPITRPGVCIACGTQNTPLIQTCEFQTVGELKNDHWTDPHVIYSDETPRSAAKAADLTASRKFKMDRPWPDLLAQIIKMIETDSESEPSSFLIIGFATNKAKNIDVWERTIGIPADRTKWQTTATSMLSQWHKQGSSLEKIMRKNEGAPFVASIRPYVENLISAQITLLLDKDPAAWKQAAREYQPMMSMLAKSLAPGITTAAITKRHEIANAVPNMQTPLSRQKGETD